MIAVLAEDSSDAETLAVLIKRICRIDNMKVPRKGFGGCGALCRKAASHILNFSDCGATHFVICHDSDGSDPDEIRTKVREGLKDKINIENYNHIIAVPVQEIEAWIIADEGAIASVIPSLKIAAINWPETIDSPKEWLIDKSQKGRTKPTYDPVTYNPIVAKYLDIDKVSKKCRSFNELVKFVIDSGKNKDNSGKKKSRKRKPS